MPTPSDLATIPGTLPGSCHQPRSVFGNQSPHPNGPPAEPAPVTLPHGWAPTVEGSLARAFVYRYLAQAFEYPHKPGWEWLGAPGNRSALQTAVMACSARPAEAATAPSSDPGSQPSSESSLLAAAAGLVAALETVTLDDYLVDYIDLFGHAARGTCPLNEIEYGDLKADPLFQAHRLADLAAFYRAFGVELADDAGERQDHLAIELEFMAVLAASEAYAVDRQLDENPRALGYHAQRRFLREHLGRWLPGFTRRLERLTGATFLGCLARFAREFVEADCCRFQVQPGSDELCLRPVDESSESLCDTCGEVKPPSPAPTR